jgi:hypothetical protein
LTFGNAGRRWRRQKRKKLAAPSAESQQRSTMLRDRVMDSAYLSAWAALAGSIVGALTSGIATWLSQRAGAGHLVQSLSRREDIYNDFIVAASKAYGDALVTNEPHIQEIVALYDMISMMRVLSSPRTVECADEVLQTALGNFFTPNKTILSCANWSGTGRRWIR